MGNVLLLVLPALLVKEQFSVGNVQYICIFTEVVPGTHTR